MYLFLPAIGGFVIGTYRIHIGFQLPPDGTHLRRSNKQLIGDFYRTSSGRSALSALPLPLKHFLKPL